jgi:Zn-dependent protease with chaperone function
MKKVLVLAAVGEAATGLTLLIVGYVGVLFGRLIQAAVSRQREFLADASSVQFAGFVFQASFQTAAAVKPDRSRQCRDQFVVDEDCLGFEPLGQA